MWDKRQTWAQSTDGLGGHDYGIRVSKTGWVIFPLGLNIFRRQSSVVSLPYPKIMIYPASLSHPCKQLSQHLTEGTNLPLSKAEGSVLWEHIYLWVLPFWSSSTSAAGEGKIKRAAEQPGWGNAVSWRKGDALGGAVQQHNSAAASKSWLQQTMSQFNLNLTASDVRKAVRKQQRRGGLLEKNLLLLKKHCNSLSLY